MKRILCTLGIIFSIAIILGLSIWLGFPSPHYDRVPICFAGYFLSVVGLVASAGVLIGDSF